MTQVHIVTDSTADVPPYLASELGISVIPCLVYVGGRAYRDGVELSSWEFFERLASGVDTLRTSQPPLIDFVSTYQRLFEEEQSEGIVSIHVPNVFSGTLNAAWTAAQQMPDPAKVEVIDSGTISMGMGWIAVEAARMARQGATLADLSRIVPSLIQRSRAVAMIDTLENLYKGGRASQISALLATALQIKPLLNLHGGEVKVWDKVRTRSRALKRLVSEVDGWGPMAEMAIMHGGAVDMAHNLAEMLDGLVPAERVILEPAGAAVIAHLGLGAVGVCALLGKDRT